MEGGFLLDHHPASTGTPMRVQVGHLAEMRRQANDPLGINSRQRSGEELRGFDDFAANHPGRLTRLLGLARSSACRRRTTILSWGALRSVEQHRSRKHSHHPIADALVLVALLADGHMPQKPGQDATMDRVLIGRTFVELHAVEIFQGPLQLRVQVLPFTHAEVGKEVLAAKLPPSPLSAE